MTESTVTVRALRDTAYINLRGDPDNASFRKAVESAIGQSLPSTANTISAGNHRVFWLGPDEWLISCAANRSRDLLDALNGKLAGHHAAVNDVSGGNIGLELSGNNVRDVFAKGCTLDFHTDVFGAGDCAQSGLAKANVLVGMTAAPDTFDVIVRRSFADYLLQWLRQAGSEYGIEFR